MAGHRKWSKVKHIKGPLDQKRGQLFSKLANEIAVAARMGGGDPSRLILTKNRGNLAAPGAVPYMFHRKGRVTVPTGAIQEESLFDLAIEAAGEELAQEDEHDVITTAPDQLYAVAEALKNARVQEEAIAQLSIH